MRLAILVDIAEIGFTIKPVIALRGEDKPSTIAAPRVISVALLTIDVVEVVDGACLEVHHLEVSLRVPDGESAVIGYGIENETSIRAETRMTNTPFAKKCVDLRADGTSALVEGNADETIL